MYKDAIWFRMLAMVVAASLLVACTRSVARKPLEERHYRVDWEQMDSQQVRLPNGLIADGVPLTPAQWPLEGSLKRLGQLDFIGVFTDFDLRFSSSSLDHETLRNLFDEGYVPVLVRVRNPGAEPLFFSPVQLSLLADAETRLYTVPPEVLPERFSKVDWGRTAGAVLMSVLFVFVVLAAAKDGRSPSMNFVRFGSEISTDLAHGAALESSAGRKSLDQGSTMGGEGQAGSMQEARKTPGVLYSASVAAGGQMEGFVFFQLDQTVVDWRTVQLSGP